MSKRGRKKQGNQRSNAISNECGNISQEQLIEIQTEAYYRAFKRIAEENANAKESKKMEEEKTDTKELAQEKKKGKWCKATLSVLNVLFFPWKISKRFRLKERLYDSALVAIVSGMVEFIGSMIWLFSIVITIGCIIDRIKQELWCELPFVILVGLMFVFVGSLLVLTGEDFSKEEDSNRIYAFSSSIIALISFVVSVIALVKC